MNRHAWVVFVFIILTCIVCSSTTVMAAGTGSINGAVVSANGGPIQGATVELFGGGGTARTQSGKDGSFSFAALDAGTYVVRVSAKLYETTSSQPLPLGAGQSLSLQVALQPVTTTNIATLGRVSVLGRATLNTAPAPTFTVTGSQMVSQGAVQINNALENLNGLTMERYDNGAPGAVTTFTIRGAGGFGGGSDGGSNTGYEILVLQDGEPLRNGQFGDFDTSSLTPAIYSRVEVLKGVSGASLFGANTIGGTINLVTRDPAKTEGGEFIMGIGGFGTTDFNLSETNTLGRFGYIFDLHTYGTNGFVPSDYLAFFAGNGTCCVAHPTQQVSLQSFLGKLRYDFSDSTYAVVDSTLESDRRDQLGLIGDPNFTGTGGPITDPSTGLPSFFGFPGDYVWNIQPKYAAELHTSIGGGSLILRSYAQLLERVVDGTNEPVDLPCCFITRSVDHLTGDLVSYTREFGSHNITIGAGANGDNFYFGQNPTNPNFPFNGLNVPFSQLQPTAQGNELYRTYLVRDDFSADPKLDVTLAAFYSNYNTVKVKRFDPRLALVFKPDDASVIKASYGTGFAPPQLSALYSALNLDSLASGNGPGCSFCVANSGNINLKAETASGGDLGYQRTFAHSGNFELDLYRTNVADHIFYGVFPAPPGLMFTGRFPGPVTFISMPVNIAGTVFTGLESSATIPLSQDFHLGYNYAIQSAYPTGVDAPTAALLGDVVNNQQYLGVPLHKYGWTAGYGNPGQTTVSFGGNYYGNGNAYNQPPFWIYNASASLPVGHDALHINWTNIFNRNAGLWSTFDLGQPLLGAPGYTSGCRNDNTLPNFNPNIYCTTGYNSPPHMLMVTFDHRWGSLR